MPLKYPRRPVSAVSMRFVIKPKPVSERNEANPKMNQSF